MRATVGLMIALVAAAAGSPASAEDPRPHQEIMDAVVVAFRAGDWPTLCVELDAAQLQRPYSLFLTRNRILARALDGRAPDALTLAREVAERGLAMDFDAHPALVEFAEHDDFAPIAALMEENRAARGEATLVFEVADPGLLPEAYAPLARGALVGSVRTGSILAVDHEANTRVVAQSAGGVFDLEVRGDRVWAVVNSQLAYEHAEPESPWAAIEVFDLETGRRVRTVRVAEADALLGDLEVARDGVAYASDSQTPRLFRLAPHAAAFEVFATDPRFANLQGLALDEEHDRLFVADYLSGLFVVEIQTATVRSIAAPSAWHLGGIDGLVLARGALIGVQNGTLPHRIVRMELDDEATRVEGFEVLQQNLPQWHEPTHGAVVGSEFHYIATSNWPSYDEAGAVREGARMEPLRVLSVVIAPR